MFIYANLGGVVMISSRFWCRPFSPILPTTLGEGMSYYEEMRKIFYHFIEFTKEVNAALKNVETEVDNLTDSIMLKVKQYTDLRYNDIKASLSEFQTEFQKFQNDVNTEIASYYLNMKEYSDTNDNKLFQYILKENEKFNTYFQNVNDRIENILSRLSQTELHNQQYYNQLLKYLEANFKSLESELTKMIEASVGDNIIVFNPVTNQYDNLNKTLKDIYHDIHWLGAITAFEYDNMHLTAEDYDNRHISAYDYDNKARFIFLKELYLS